MNALEQPLTLSRTERILLLLLGWLGGALAGGFAYVLVRGVVAATESGAGSLIALPLVLPITAVLGGGIAVAAAFYIAAYLLLIGLALVGIGAVWAPARHWIAWAVVAASAALFLSPNGVDPLPPPGETAAALVAALVSALLFRFAIVPNRRVDLARQPVTELLAGAILFGSLVPAALFWRTHYAERQRFDVKYETYSPSSPTRDMSAVDLVLHEYGDSSEQQRHGRYWTTGRSLRFRLPMAYLHEVHLQRGGGQRQISIHADPLRLGPVTVGRRGGTPRTDINLALASPESVGGEYGAEAKMKYDRDPENYVGDACGMWWVLDDYGGTANVKTHWPESLWTRRDRLVGAIREPSGTAATGALCSTPAGCRISFDYRGFEGHYWLERRRICDWREQTDKVVALLDRHLVGETLRRSAY